MKLTALLRLLPFLLLLLATPATAQFFHVPLHQQHKFRWPNTFGPAAPMTRLVAADFTGDLVKDVVCLGDGKVAFLYGPYSHESVALVPFSARANDIDAAPKAGGEGKDALVGVGVFGLSSMVWNASTGVFEEHLLGSAAWIGAKLVRSADINYSTTLNTDRVADYVGVAADGNTLIVLQDPNGSGGALQETTFHSYGNSPVREIVLLNWDADEQLEIAISSDYGFEVRERSGTLVRRNATPGISSDAIASFHAIGVSTDLVAWAVTDSAGTTQNLYVARSSAPLLTLQTPISVVNPAAGQAVIAMSSADTDADGDDELVLVTNADFVPWIYRNDSASESSVCFSDVVASREQVPQSIDSEFEESSPTVPNHSNVVLADLDGDPATKPDMLVAVEPTEHFVVLSAADVVGVPDPIVGGSCPILGGVCTENFRSGLLRTTGSAPPGTLTLRLNFGLTVPAGSSLEIARYDMLTGTGMGYIDASLPAENYRKSLNPLPALVPTNDVEFTWPLASTDFISPGGCLVPRMWFEARLVTRDAAGALTWASKSVIGVVSTQSATISYYNSTPYHAYWLDLDPEGGTWNCDVGGGEEGIVYGTTPTSPATIQRRALPPSGTGDIPKLPATAPILGSTFETSVY